MRLHRRSQPTKHAPAPTPSQHHAPQRLVQEPVRIPTPHPQPAGAVGPNLLVGSLFLPTNHSH